MKNLFIHRKDYRLSYRLLLSILICSSFFTIIGTAVQLYVDYNKDIERIHNSISHIKKGYLQPIAGSLWAMDVIQLKRNLEGAANFPDMQYLEVREKRKKSEVTVEAIGIRKDADIISKSYPLFYGKDNRQIGTLLVVASKEGVFKRLQDKVLLNISNSGFKDFFRFNWYSLHLLFPGYETPQSFI